MNDYWWDAYWVPPHIAYERNRIVPNAAAVQEAPPQAGEWGQWFKGHGLQWRKVTTANGHWYFFREVGDGSCVMQSARNSTRPEMGFEIGPAETWDGRSVVVIWVDEPELGQPLRVVLVPRAGEDAVGFTTGPVRYFGENR